MAENPRLICLPPAGGGPGLFRPWQQADSGIEAPSLPGREARLGEPLPAELTELADSLAAVAPRLPRRYGLFGYSMGGTLAFLLAERLVARGLPGPEALFLLGAPAPEALATGTDSIHTLDSDAFWDEIARIGGTPDEILHAADMRALFEPTLRGDFRLCDTYRHRASGFRLDCPIHVFIAEEDHLVDGASAEEWAAYTAGPTRLHRVPGPHMLDPASFVALRARIRSLWPQPAALPQHP